MPPFDTIATRARKDGLSYCVGLPLPAAEADLLQQPGLNPAGEPGVSPGQGVLTLWGTGLTASVLFQVQAPFKAGQAFVVCQGDDGNDSWFDLAGCLLPANTPVGGSALFLLPLGPFGNVAVLQQTRQPGTPPPANFANPSPMPGRFRFVGQAPGSGSGSGAAVQVSIWYRPTPLR